MLCVILCFFFFKQKTAYEMRISDWSSDVCSSDLGLHYDVLCRPHQSFCGKTPDCKNARAQFSGADRCFPDRRGTGTTYPQGLYLLCNGLFHFGGDAKPKNEESDFKACTAA